MLQGPKEEAVAAVVAARVAGVVAAMVAAADENTTLWANAPRNEQICIKNIPFQQSSLLTPQLAL